MVLKLPCAACRLPFAVVDGDRLLVQSRHNAERHVNALTLEELERLVVVMRASRDGGGLRVAS